MAKSECSVCQISKSSGMEVDTSVQSNVWWAKHFGVSEASIRRHLKHVPEQHPRTPKQPLGQESYEESSDGSKVLTGIRDRAVTLEDARLWIQSSGDQPDDYNLSIRSIAYGEGLWSNRMSATPKVRKGSTVSNFDLAEAISIVERWEKPQEVPIERRPMVTMVICPADQQIGKTDWGGKTEDTIKRILNSYSEAADIASEYQPDEIVIAELGDSIENIYSTSSQRGTNDKSITEQITIARRLALEGIKLLYPHTNRVVYASVPSNHGSVRIGPKSPENHVLDDYGIEIAHQIEDVVANSWMKDKVSVVIPEFNYESLCIETSGTRLGMAHGHQANNADGLGTWWRGQSHGRMPLAEADIALFGHFHSLRVQQSGDARWLFVSPAQDNGSSWFTNKTGERSKSGMLSFFTNDGNWSDLRVL